MSCMQHVGMLQIMAPLSGMLLPLEQLPDSTFAHKLLGEGIAIDPVSSVMLAPVSGVIVQLHAARHAVVIRTDLGIEVMVHIGLDTVMLKGQGFEQCCRLQQRVKIGDVLIRFDADAVAVHARSLLTQIIVMSDEGWQTTPCRVGMVEAGKDCILTMAPIPSAVQAPQHVSDVGVAVCATVLVINPFGLHARPSAQLSSCAKRFSADIYLQKDTQQVNAKSASAILKLGLQHADSITLSARGSDAQAAIEAMTALLHSGCGEDMSVIGAFGAQRKAKPAAFTALLADIGKQEMPIGDVWRGQPAVPGKAVGTIFQLSMTSPPVIEDAVDMPQQHMRLQQALQLAGKELSAMHRHRSDITAAIFLVHQEFLEDPELLDACAHLIQQGKSAAFAWRQVCLDAAQALAGLDNAQWAARAHDLEDISSRVIRHLLGEKPALPKIPPGSIVIADKLTPSQMAGLDASTLAGCCLVQGTSTSHAAMIARARNIPLICGIPAAACRLADATPAVIDAVAGILRLNPMQQDIDAIRAAQAQYAAERAPHLEGAEATQPAITLDGRRIDVAANIAAHANGLADIEQSLANGADGVGLLRTEFLYFDRDEAPGEDEQEAVYLAMAKKCGPHRSLIIRTLDAGGDKPLAYLTPEREENPFLGMRGIRLCLEQPEMLRVQFRAMLKVAHATRLHIMFPMIAALEEWWQVREMLERERRDINPDAEIKVGIMIEVPAAAMMADKFAREVDFFSIGSNDLAQYMLAMDRCNAKLGERIDAVHPAVLRMIAATVAAAHAHHKWVGLCGNLAADVEALPLLLGLGLDELSVALPTITGIKQGIRSLRLEHCKSLAKQALDASTTQEVRTLLRRTSCV